jgi:hypothetical protein
MFSLLTTPALSDRGDDNGSQRLKRIVDMPVHEVDVAAVLCHPYEFEMILHPCEPYFGSRHVISVIPIDM